MRGQAFPAHGMPPLHLCPVRQKLEFMLKDIRLPDGTSLCRELKLIPETIRKDSEYSVVLVQTAYLEYLTKRLQHDVVRRCLRLAFG